MEPIVMDTDDAAFEVDVIEASRTRPVVVDLWAEWCAPCRILGPILEGLAREKEGAFLLAKVDVDANPVVSQRFQVRGIPAVKGFVGGELVDEFAGALPEDQVRRWLNALLPSGADRTAEAAARAEEGGDLDSAEEGYRKALAEEPRHAGAGVGLARLVLARGEIEEAEELVRPLVPDPEAERILAAARVARWIPGGSDPRARARGLAANGRFREALEEMMLLVVSDAEVREDVLDVFTLLGDDDTLTREFRPKLAAALF